MFDLNGCNDRYDAHRAWTARITAHGQAQPAAAPRRTARARLAVVLVALAARLDPTLLAERPRVSLAQIARA